jgi:hypothetical protein
MASVQLPPRWGRFFGVSPEGTTVEFVGIEAFRHVDRVVIDRSQSPISRSGATPCWSRQSATVASVP